MVKWLLQRKVEKLHNTNIDWLETQYGGYWYFTGNSGRGDEYYNEYASYQKPGSATRVYENAPRVLWLRAGTCA